LVSITGYAVYRGLATALDTLCAQAYGSGHKTLVGVHMQRMVCFLWMVTIPVGLIWFSSPWILSMIVAESAELKALQTRIRGSIAAQKQRYLGLRAEVRRLIDARRAAEVAASRRAAARTHVLRVASASVVVNDIGGVSTGPTPSLPDACLFLDPDQSTNGAFIRHKKPRRTP